MNPVLRHWLIGFLFSLASLLLVGAADYVQANSIPGIDDLFVPTIVGCLLAFDKWLRTQKPPQE